MKKQDYTAKDIYVIKGLQLVGKRPAIYISLTDILYETKRSFAI